MKRYLILVLAILTSGLAVFFYQRQSVNHWHGSFRIGDNTIVPFITVGHNIFYDANSDGIPQGDELIAPNGEVRILSEEGGEEFKLQDISTTSTFKFISHRFSPMIDVTIQSNQNANVAHWGTVTMTRRLDKAETCHLMGPLSFLPPLKGFKLTAGESNLIKIRIGTCNQNDSPMTAAVIRSSQIGDQTKYAFADAERPKLKIWLDGETKQPEELIADGFC